MQKYRCRITISLYQMFSWIKSRSRVRDLGACGQMNTAINRRACARGSILAACTPCILLKGAREKENSRLFEHKNYSSTGILLIHQKLYVSKTPWHLEWLFVTRVTHLTAWKHHHPPPVHGGGWCTCANVWPLCWTDGSEKIKDDN